MHNPSGSTWAAILSAVFAGASWFVARDARKSAKKSLEIEASRRHAELEPRFSAEIWGRPGTTTYALKIHFLGPIALQDLDKIRIEIRDVKKKPADPAQGIVPASLQLQLWAAYRFTPGVNGAPATGREVTYENFSVDDITEFQIEDNPIPTGTSAVWWRETIQSINFRIWIHCEKEGYDNWKVPLQPSRHF